MSTFGAKRNCSKKQSIERFGLNDRIHSVFYAPSPVDDFLFEENANGSYNLTSDIQMLLNQKRLDKLTLESLIAHFDTVSQKSDLLRELRSKLSDQDLVKLVKSRYIQTPSELMAYSECLLSEYSRLSREAQELIDAQDSADPTKIMDTVEPQKTVEPN